MSEDRWTAVDRYVEGLLAAEDEALAAARADSAAQGLPAIAVTAAQGRLLWLLARLARARHVLEIGTLGGYSAIWMARALPKGGRLVSLELDAHHADVARRNVARAGLDATVEIRVGAALDLLPPLAAEGREPFDFVFIDADKPNNPHYFTWAMKLARPGALIVVDNVVRDGAVADAASRDPNVLGSRAVLQTIARESRVRGTVIQTVGEKGYDGFAFAIVDGGPARSGGGR